MASLRPPAAPKPEQVIGDPMRPMGPQPAQTLDPGGLKTLAPDPTHMTNTAAGPYGINWGTVVSDPAEQSRILGLATDMVNRNEAGSGLGANSYAPGHSREDAIREAAYSFFPTFGGGGASAGATGAAGTGAGGFTGTAPKPTPYGDFVPPVPGSLSAAADFRAKEGQKAIQNSAAAKGTLLNTGTLKALEAYRQGLASQEYQNDFDRALSVYDTNRDTNAQNYGQQNTSTHTGLDIFGTNDRSAQDWARIKMQQDAMAADNPIDTTGNPRTAPTSPIGSLNDFAQQVAALRAQQQQAPLPPPARTPFPFQYREAR